MAMDKVAAEALNQAFYTQIESPEGRQELSEITINYIKQLLREESFSRKILPPEPVTRQDIQRQVDDDSVVKIVDIEPDSRALAVNFRSETEARFIEAKRYAIPFFRIESELFEKTEEELYAYEMPVIKVIEENSVKDIQEIEDTFFIRFAQQAVTQTGKVLTDALTPRLTKSLLTDGFKLIDADRLQTAVILMANTTYDDVLNFNQPVVGDSIASKIIVDGYTFDQLLGKKLIISNKSTNQAGCNLLPFGQVWFFTDPEYLGNFYILNTTKLYMDKRGPLINWQAWESIGMGFGNIKSIAKLEYGSGVGVPVGC
jgi:hypothetical protein